MLNTKIHFTLYASAVIKNLSIKDIVVVGFFKVILNGRAGEIYNIGNPNNEINLVNLKNIFDKITAKKNKFKRIEYPKNYPGDEPFRRCPDIKKSILHTGYKPVVSIQEGIRRVLNFNKMI